MNLFNYYGSLPGHNGGLIRMLDKTITNVLITGYDLKKGFGGACLPKDTLALLRFSEDQMSILKSVLNINIEQDIIVKRILGRQTCSKCGLIFNKFFYHFYEKIS